MGEREGQGTIRAPHSAQSARPTTGAKQYQPTKQRQLKPRDYEELKKAEQGAYPYRQSTPPEGLSAALAEYKVFKAAGMLKEWRNRWRNVLSPTN